MIISSLNCSDMFSLNVSAILASSSFLSSGFILTKIIEAVAEVRQAVFVKSVHLHNIAVPGNASAGILGVKRPDGVPWVFSKGVDPSLVPEVLPRDARDRRHLVHVDFAAQQRDQHDAAAQRQNDVQQVLSGQDDPETADVERYHFVFERVEPKQRAVLDFVQTL
eukprot:CAMPEP_0168327126 /NCGR_PEP_ID=MMETSP0213-20121227/5721_1 /TAXON_ID=151035 /ORGANISM="Euplotes harpa, Strain FSP1.4" /LENGTH=164 /DNA_ID=CAMNT_0008329989 /DNA_START=214 /DNA_END=707 /DNA_ORIENTATION=+